MKALMPRFIRCLPESRYTVIRNHVLDWGGSEGLVPQWSIDRTTNGLKGSLVSNWAAEFPHLPRWGSVCGPTLRTFCQHQLCDIYSKLPHLPRQQLDMAPAILGFSHPTCIFTHDQQNPVLDSVVEASAGGVGAEIVTNRAGCEGDGRGCCWTYIWSLACDCACVSLLPTLAVEYDLPFPLLLLTNHG